MGNTGWVWATVRQLKGLDSRHVASDRGRSPRRPDSGCLDAPFSQRGDFSMASWFRNDSLSRPAWCPDCRRIAGVLLRASIRWLGISRVFNGRGTSRPQYRHADSSDIQLFRQLCNAQRHNRGRAHALGKGSPPCWPNLEGVGCPVAQPLGAEQSPRLTGRRGHGNEGI
jgi:hypothetical protein